MRRIWVVLVPSLVLLLSACARTHTREEDASREDAPCTTRPVEVTRVCQPVEVPSGVPIPIRVAGSCGDCSLAGPCEVTVGERSITVRPTRTDCGAPCVSECEQTCMTPPLEVGGYRVRVEGHAPHHDLRVRERDGMVGEVCTHR